MRRPNFYDRLKFKITFRVSYWKHYLWLTFRSTVLQRPVTIDEIKQELLSLRSVIMEKLL